MVRGKSALKLLLFILLIFIVMGLSPWGSRLEASSGVSMKLNNEYLSFDQDPIIDNGVTLVPFRAIMEALGAQVSWDAATGDVTAVRGDTRINLNLADKIISISGERVTYDEKMQARVVNGRTLVPARIISEAMGAEVIWHEEERTVQINLLRVEKINLDKRDITLDLGETATIKATIIPEDAANKNIRWNSTNPSVASVDRISRQEAEVISREGGNAIIFARSEDGGFVATSQVTVEAADVEVTGISLNRRSITMVAGDSSTTIPATVSPSNASNPKVIWETDDSSVVSVGSKTVTDGTVTPLEAGEATITARTEDGDFVETCRVIVEPYAIPVRGITLRHNNRTLDVDDDPQTLRAYFEPERASNQEVIWESSDTNVVTVSKHYADPSDGIVEARLVAQGEGRAQVTVTTEDGEYQDTCVVVVTD